MHLTTPALAGIFLGAGSCIRQQDKNENIPLVLLPFPSLKIFKPILVPFVAQLIVPVS